jgi:hypothetical protein
MMPFRSRWLAIVLGAVHVTLTTVGEALHLLPGLGHFEGSPCGACLWAGAARHDHLSADAHAPGVAWAASDDESSNVFDDEECPICHLVSLA